ncbi:outer membrane protein assembly factor BamE domain-containing protein [Achromobacter aegrifaciens]
MRTSLLFVAAIMTGCASSPGGNLLTEAKVQAIKPNVTTYDEMVRDYGAPRSQSVNREGLTTATWFYFNNSAYGAMDDQQTLTVIYNKDRTVKDYVNASAGSGKSQ